jgi:hypothetical protein
MQQFVQKALVVLAVVCIFAYTAVAICFALSKLGVAFFSFADVFFTLGDYRFMFGLPMAGVAAAAIVSVFQAVAPSQTDDQGNLSFEAFGAKFSGPAVPATLWIVTYLALVVSIVAVSRADQPPDQQSQSETAPRSTR